LGLGLVLSFQICALNAEVVLTRSNPFLTAEEEQYFKDERLGTSLDYLLLSAIFYFPGQSKAIINGQILKVSDFIDNKEIVEILPNAVILQDNKGEYFVGLKKVKIK